MKTVFAVVTSHPNGVRSGAAHSDTEAALRNFSDIREHALLWTEVRLYKIEADLSEEANEYEVMGFMQGPLFADDWTGWELVKQEVAGPTE